MSKIAYYATSVIPSKTANSVHVMKMCQAFARLGHEVTLVVSDQMDIITDNVYEFYGVDKNFNIQRIHKKGIKGKSIIFAIDAAKYIMQHDFDLIYGRSGLIYTLLLIFCKGKIGFEIHQPQDNDLISKIMKHFVKKRSIRMVAISNSLKQFVMKEYKLSDEDVLVAHDGADEMEDVSTITSLPVDAFNIGYVGQLYPGKGMEIIEQLAKLNTDVAFHIIGGNDKDICNWKNKLKGVKNIVFYGFIPHRETQRYIQAMDAVIAPYMRNVYGSGYDKSLDKSGNLANYMSPLKIFEYMASGKPIITSDLDVIKEVLEDGKTGLLCNPDDMSEWCNAIIKLREDITLRKTISKNAKKTFLEKYTWNKRAEKIASFFELQ